jgi:beta-lactam-binding protein with PASTA domain
LKYNKNEFPIDILGFKLEEAIEELSKAGLSFQILEIFPKTKKEISGELRVIKQEVNNGINVLTVCKIELFKDNENEECE